MPKASRTEGKPDLKAFHRENGKEVSARDERKIHITKASCIALHFFDFILCCHRICSARARMQKYGLRTLRVDRPFRRAIDLPLACCAIFAAGGVFAPFLRTYLYSLSPRGNTRWLEGEAFELN